MYHSRRTFDCTLMTTRRVFLREGEDANNKLNETLEVMIILYDQKNLSITEMGKIFKKNSVMQL